MIADCITVRRVLFSLLLWVTPPHSWLFTAAYWLCGVTDVPDGFVARKLHTECPAGARLDSAADFVFAVSYAFVILPLLHLPIWIHICIAVITGMKLCAILKTGKKPQSSLIPHSTANRLCGVLIFLLPLTSRLWNVSRSAAGICLCAAFAASEELFLPKGLSDL